MKLMSMVDFVLEQSKVQIDEKRITTSFLHLFKIYKYANFLKQPLELWMFVPCDENNNPLLSINEKEEWFRKTYDSGWWGEFLKYKEKYKKAKERVLFKECAIKKIKDYYGVSNGNYIFWVSWNDSFNIESIIKHNLELTETAIKQING